MSETLPRPAVAALPARPADGIEVLGPMAGSGYRNPPVLVRRADGQMVQITPLLAAVLEAADGRRDAAEMADHIEVHHGRALHPDDVAHLLTAQLGPMGLVRFDDRHAPDVRRSDPLLGLRGRIQLAGPERTNAIARPFQWLFRPPVVAVVLLAFSAFSAWVIVRHGLGSAIDEAIADPMLLLGIIALVLASGAFHEIGHAAACRYGGAQPRAMGAAVYLVWPAFYTDVTESYRLDRRGRLRVDLGGLYFNAVFTVATGAAWAFTGTEALLVLVPVQLLQMARQLVPIVRFDGYHILADLVGVPDLFARIRPTLARAVPGRRVAAPNPLTPRAQAVVVTWVVVVVPFLLSSLGLLVWNLPSIVASSLHSLHLQWDLFRENATAGRIAAAALGIVAMATVAFLPASAAYLSARIARRSGTRFWRATDGRPALRSASLAVVFVALVAAVGPRIGPPDAGTSELAGSVTDERVTELADGSTLDARLAARRPAPTPAPTPAPAPIPAPPAIPAPPPAAVTVMAPPAAPEPVVVAVAVAPARAPRAVPQVPKTIRSAWPFSFARPGAAGPGGNQAMAVGTVDGATEVALATSVQWLADEPVRNRNEAYAFAQCIDCRTVAAAFQVVAASGRVDTAIPENIAVSVNETCESCATAAIAVQLAVTLVEQPPQEVKAQVDGIVQRLDGLQAALRTAALDEIGAELEAARSEVLTLLDPWIVDAADQVEPGDEATETAEPAEPAEADGATPDTTEEEQAEGSADGEGTVEDDPAEEATLPEDPEPVEEDPAVKDPSGEPVEPVPSEEPAVATDDTETDVAAPTSDEPEADQVGTA